MPRTVAATIAVIVTACAGNPTPAAPLAVPMLEREVAVRTPAASLGATFTAPGGASRVPAVVIVHGSGPADRDLTLGPNTPYRDIAEGLAARGIATLRYDKRTKVVPYWFAGRRFTVQDETIDDAVAAVALVRMQPEVDPDRVVVIGHSLGGMLAPRIAAQDGQLAGIVIMAGATDVMLVDQLVRQIEYIASQPGADTATIRGQQRMLAPMIAEVRALTPADSGATKLVMGAPAAYWLDLAAYSSATMLRGMMIPALVLQGERDYQVTPAQLDQWLGVVGDRAALEVIRYPSLDHLFMAGTGPSTPADYAEGRHVDVRVIDDIARWVRSLRPVAGR